MNLFDVCRAGLVACSAKDIQGVETFLKRIGEFGPTGMLFLRFAVPWSLADCANGHQMDSEQRAAAVAHVMKESGLWAPVLSVETVTTLVDVASGEPANGRRIPDDELYLVLLAVLHYALVECYGRSGDWQMRFARLIEDFRARHVSG